jgi:hypothetical protein
MLFNWPMEVHVLIQMYVCVLAGDHGPFWMTALSSCLVCFDEVQVGAG